MLPARGLETVTIADEPDPWAKALPKSHEGNLIRKAEPIVRAPAVADLL